MSLDLNIASTASLLAASLDLDLVRLLREAIRRADLSAAASAGGNACPAAPPPQATPAPSEPRVTYCSPEPYFEPRPVFYRSAGCYRSPALAPPAPVVIESAPSKVPDCELPFQPPWKVLPWQNPPPVILKIKPITHRPSEILKGKTIDLFI